MPGWVLPVVIGGALLVALVVTALIVYYVLKNYCWKQRYSQANKHEELLCFISLTTRVSTGSSRTGTRGTTVRLVQVEKQSVLAVQLGGSNK